MILLSNKNLTVRAVLYIVLCKKRNFFSFYFKRFVFLNGQNLNVNTAFSLQKAILEIGIIERFHFIMIPQLEKV